MLWYSVIASGLHSAASDLNPVVSDFGLHCLLRPVCPNTYTYYGGFLCPQLQRSWEDILLWACLSIHSYIHYAFLISKISKGPLELGS